VNQAGLRRGAFKTRRGYCACEWSSRGLSRLVLPCETAAKAVRRLGTGAAGMRGRSKVPAPIRAAVERALACHPYRAPRYDLSHLTPFQRRVLRAASRIPPGSYLSYGQLACLIGKPRACRAVGQAMNRNPSPLLIPCHRVVASGNRLGGFEGGQTLKKKMLENEGIIIRGRSKVLYRP
jgi:methylated-DNA-[protein]-cysteine S-methyltransferase